MNFVQAQYSTIVCPSYFVREKLFSLLDSYDKASLIGIYGNSGYGKTTLISSYVREKKIPTIWYSLKGIDNFAHNFLSDLRKKLNDLVPQSNQHLEVQPENSEKEMDAIIRILFSYSSSIFIVFDDYELADNNQEVQYLIDHLLSTVIPKLTIVIISRVRPSRSFAKLRTQQRYIELNTQDLAFSRAETYEFFNQFHQASLQDHEINFIYRKTEGWVASYQLILQALQKTTELKRADFLLNLSKNIPDIFGYLDKEIFAVQSEELQSFLLKTSLMTELDPVIINQFLGIENGQEVIDYLFRYHLFIDNNEFGKARYHRLFRQFLYEKYACNNTMIEQEHIKLSQIYQEMYQFVNAFAHATIGKDYIRATNLMRNIESRYNPLKFINIIDGWLEELSPTMFLATTTRFLTRCIPVSILTEFIVPLSESIILEQERKNLLRVANLQHRLATIYFVCGEILKARSLFEESLNNAATLHDYTMMAFNLNLIAKCYLHMEKYNKGIQFAKRALFLSERHRIRDTQIITLDTMAWLCMKQQNLEQANTYIIQALDLSVNDPDSQFWLFLSMSQLLLLKGEYTKSISWAQKAVDFSHSYNFEYDTAFSYWVLGQSYLADKRWDQAEICFATAYDASSLCVLVRYYIVLSQVKLYRLTGDSFRENQKHMELTKICKDQGYDWFLEKIEPNRKTSLTIMDSELPLKIQVLGTFAMEYKGKPVILKRTSSLRLLQYFIANRQQSINRDVIVAQIFPESRIEDVNHFHVALSGLRKALEPELRAGKDSAFLTRSKDRYRLNAHNIQLDVEEFCALCLGNQDALKKDKITNLLKAEQLYQGDFFEEYPYESFLEIEREKTRLLFIQVLRDLAQYFRNHNENVKSIEYYEKLLSIDPYLEEIYLEYLTMLLELKAESRAKRIVNRMTKYLEHDLGIQTKDKLSILFPRFSSSARFQTP